MTPGNDLHLWATATLSCNCSPPMPQLPNRLSNSSIPLTSHTCFQKTISLHWFHHIVLLQNLQWLPMGKGLSSFWQPNDFIVWLLPCISKLLSYYADHELCLSLNRFLYCFHFHSHRNIFLIAYLNSIYPKISTSYHLFIKKYLSCPSCVLGIGDSWVNNSEMICTL